MPRRLEIELTSRRDDGTWTWRAAGARQPRGEVAGELLPDSASVGAVLRIEADGGLDGLEVTAVFAPKARSDSADRLELIGGGAGPLVTTRLVSQAGRRPSDLADEGDRTRRAGQRRGGGREARGRKPRRGDDSEPQRPRTPRGDRDRQSEADSDRGPRTPRGDRSDANADRAARRGRGGADLPGGARRDPDGRRGTGRDSRGRRDGDESGARRDDGRAGRGSDPRPAKSSKPAGRERTARHGRPQRAPQPRLPALKPRRVHRRAALASLPDEQQHLASEVLKGGVPGLRKSIDRMNAQAAAEKLPQIKSEPLIALAESLAPVLKAAEWHDRADAALAGMAEVDLRDIRSVIAAADRSARSDETRALAESLRAGLASRLETDHRAWLDELAGTIHEGRTVRALRLSSRPPKAGTPLPPDMAERLANMAAADLNPTSNQQRWATVVDSIALSPVRTQVVPSGIPEKPDEDLLAAVRRLADRVPQIAALFGVEPQAPRRGRLPPPPPARAAGEGASDDRGDQAVVVEELGETVDELKSGDLA